MTTRSDNLRTLSSGNNTNNSFRNTLKVGMTPSTISTRHSMAAFDSTPATMTSADFSALEKKNSIVRDSKKSTKHILEQWRKDKGNSTNERKKLSDLTSMDNAGMIKSGTEKNDVSSVLNTTDNKEKKETSHIRIASKEGREVSVENDIDDGFLNDIFQTIDNVNSNESTVSTNDVKSATTTPTANTVMNTTGINRVGNRNKESLGVTSLNVRLFQPIINEDCESQCSQVNMQEDVSLITQDTELQNLIRPAHQERHQDEVPRDNSSKMNINKIDVRRYSSSTFHSKGIYDALTSLQTSLEKSRSICNQQETQMEHQRVIIDNLKRENAALHASRKQCQSSITDSMSHLSKEMKKISDFFNLDEKVGFDAGNSDSVDVVLNFLKRINEKVVPSFLTSLKEKTRKVKKEVNESSKLLKNIQSQISKEEQDWDERLQVLNEDLQNTRDSLQGTQNDLKLVEDELNENLSLLQKTKQQVKQKEEELTALNIDVGNRHIELSEITRMCEERIESAYAIESNAKTQADAIMKKEAKIEELHESIMKTKESLEADEKTLRIKEQEAEKKYSDFEGKLQLKKKELQEQQDDILEMTASLESKRVEIESEFQRVNAVKNELLNKESILAKEGKLLEEKKKLLDIRFDELTQRQQSLNNEMDDLNRQKRQLESEVKSQEEKLEAREIELQKSLHNLDQERDEYMSRLDALEKCEAQLKAEKKELSTKINKFKSAVKAAKTESNHKKTQLESFERDLKDREQLIDEKSRKLSEHEEELQLLIARDQVALEKLRNECETKEKELELLGNKCNEKSKRMKLFSAEVTKVRNDVEKKLKIAKTELKNLDDAYTTQKQEIEILCDKKTTISVEIASAQKARDEIMETIRVKEALLEKLERNIKKERTDWEMTMTKEKALIDSEKKVATKEAHQLLSNARSEIEKRRHQYESEQHMLSSELTTKAEQLEKLRSNLLSFQEEVDAKKEEFEKYMKDENSRLELRERLIEEKAISSQEFEKELNDIRSLLSHVQSEKQEAAVNLKKVLEKSEGVQKENSRMRLKIDDMDKQIKALKLEVENVNSLKTEKIDLEGRIALSLRDFQLLSEKFERLQTERNELKESARLFDMTDRECSTLRAEKKELLQRMNAMVSEMKSFEKREIDISRREQELEAERDAFVERMRSVEENEIKLSSIEEREQKLKSESESLSNERQLLEKQKKEHTDEVNRYVALKQDLLLKQESISRDWSMIENEKEMYQQKMDQLSNLEDELNAKMSNVAISEKKLKEYAQLMKRQSKDIKAKEKDLQKVAKLLNEKKSNDSSLVSELQLLLEEEQRRYKELSDRYERIVADHDEYTEERMQQMALKVKEKDEELSRKQQILSDKLLKCGECETRLAAWQKELENIAEALKR
mmetsp:Transcript_11625/g.21738  ORF Transcript_11625/g.21738 Transcript_11625/m.21738 type:complete len:1396 (-) Transcript_11625:110-4297(-)